MQLFTDAECLFAPTQTIFVLCKSLCINGEIFE